MRAEGCQADPLDVPNFLKVIEMGSSTSNDGLPGLASGGKPTLMAGGQKKYFVYHGSGRDPNVESWTNSVDCSDASAPSATIHRWEANVPEDEELPAEAQRPVAAPRRPGHHPKLHDEPPDADDPLGRARGLHAGVIARRCRETGRRDRA